ncbi:MAG: tetratricopeptide repeat protein [Acidobacteriota bacterium]|nr:MAG: tetratricopeptide repeat protein [Acidobacteriota bacterium]
MRPFRSVRWLVALAALASVPGAIEARMGDGVFDRRGWEAALAAHGIGADQAVYPFESTEEMRAWAERALRGTRSLTPGRRLEILQAALFSSEFGFDYDVNETRTAPQAFAVKNGNCMSFTALFVALARSVGIPAFLLSIQRAPEVDRDAGLVVLNRHVVAGFWEGRDVRTFDFNFVSAAPVKRGAVIDDVLATAMYHSNLGSAAIRARQIDSALRHLELATTLAPGWAPAWINLGVARYRSGDPNAALTAYRHALESDPTSSSAKANMAYVFQQLGMKQEAETALRAAAEKTHNPYTLISMADVEMVNGNYRHARLYLRRARWLYGKYPEVYDALARLAQRRGKPTKAEKYARRAQRMRERSGE